MNPTFRRCAMCLSMALLSAAFLISSDLSLMACAPQQTQSDTGSQASQGSVPETPQPQPAPAPQQPAQTPSGAAGAEAANPKGAPAAQPVGAAVAPARQRGHRSLLIKIGLAAGVGIAVGTVVALSAKSPTRPPGAAPANSQP